MTVIVQDADGYLWIGTQDGLNRYDGARFTRYFRDDGLPSNFVTALLVDGERRLWVGTQNGLAVRQSRGFDAVPLPVNAAGANVTALAQLGGAVFAAAGTHLVRIDEASRTATAMIYDGARGAITALGAAPDGTLIVGTQHGVLRMTANGSFEPVEPQDVLARIAVRDLAVDSRGDVWIVPEDAGLLAVHEGGAKAIGDAEGLRQHVDRITLDPASGAVLVGTEDDGVYRVSDGTAERIAGPGRPIETAFIDAERTIWAADSGRGGLLRLIRSKFDTIKQSDGLPTDQVYGIQHARDGTTWIATASALVHAQGVRFEVLHPSPDLEHAHFTGIAEGPDGTICAGTRGKGAVCFHDQAVTRLTETEGLPGDSVDDLTFDHLGRLWLATSRGVAVAENGRVMTTLGVADGLLDEATYTLYEDRSGAIWIGYWYRSGVSRWDGRRVTHFGAQDGLPDAAATSIFQDARGRLWVTTDRGIARREGASFRAFSKRDGLPSDEVYVALEDAHGALWLSTDAGIATFQDDRVVQTFTIDDGLAANEGQSRGGALDVRGRLWFSSTGGITIIDPENIRRNEAPPHVLVEAVSAAGRAMDLSGPLPVLRYLDNNLRFDFTATSFRAPTAMRFEYELDGFDRAWTDMQRPVLVRTASYTNLPPGSYVFRVRATNDDGIWSTASAAVPFRIAAPWWRTPWALLVAAASLVGLGCAGMLTRVWALRARAAQLEAHVRARTQELAARLAELAERNEALAAANRRAERIFSALAEALPGSVLDGKYKLGERIGGSGSGAVFRATHVELQREVAVKVLRPAPGNDSAEALDRFRREAIVASRVRHPNAVGILDSGISSDGIAYLVMELLDGESLASLLARDSRLSLERCASIVGPVCAALQAAHDAGIVHGDLKPRNVVLHRDRNGGDPVVRVVDFGVARPLGEDTVTRPASMASGGAVVEATAFVAPERFLEETRNARSDVFSVGAIAYLAISGRLPYASSDPAALPYPVRVLSGAPARLRERVRDVPPRVERIVMRALAASASVRPTAAELGDELTAAVRELPDAVRASPLAPLDDRSPSSIATAATLPSVPTVGK